MSKKHPQNDVMRLASYWPYQVTVLADQIARRTSAVVKRYELNLSQWRVLAAVADEPGRTSAEVVTITPMDKGIVSRATKALLEMGLLTRVASQSDGRISHLYMTDQGQHLYSTILPQVRLEFHEDNAFMSEDSLASLGHQLRHLLAALSE